MTVQTALKQGATLLEEARVAAPRLNAEVLLGHAMHQRREYFYAHPEQELTPVEWLHYGRYLFERQKGKPTQYITGKQEFYGREFRVDPRVLIPRPETEHLVEAVLKRAAPNAVILDVGCGSGAIAITLALEMPGARVLASDLSGDALNVALANATRLGAPVRFFQADLLAAVAAGSLAVLVSNPPYVAHREASNLQREVRDWEPELALFGGEDGFSITRRLIEEAGRVLDGSGLLLMEMGAGQWAEHERMALAHFGSVEAIRDLAGIERALAAW